MPSLRLVRMTIASLLAGSDVSLARVADRLAVTPRSLQRHLSALGTNYREQVAQVRMVRARQLLAKTDLQIEEIAFRLGFAHASGFRRAFIHSMRMQPHAFRRARKALKDHPEEGRLLARKSSPPY